MRTLLAHRNGTRWQQVGTPASVKITNELNAIASGFRCRERAR